MRSGTSSTTTPAAGVVVDVHPEAAQQLGHDRHVGDGRDVRQGGPTHGQQGHGHQLEGAVLGAHDGHLAHEVCATDDAESLSHPPNPIGVPDRPLDAAGRVREWPHGQPDADLHAHRRRRHDEPRRLLTGQQERRPAARVRRLQRGQRRHRHRGRLRRPAGRGEGHPAARAERALRRRRRPVDAAAPDLRLPARCASSSRGSTTSRRTATTTSSRSRSCARSSCPAARPGRPTCTSRRPSCVAPSARRGRPSTSTAPSPAAEGTDARGRRRRQRPHGEVPQPPLRPALHPGPHREQAASAATCCGSPAAAASRSPSARREPDRDTAYGLRHLARLVAREVAQLVSPERSTGAITRRTRRTVVIHIPCAWRARSTAVASPLAEAAAQRTLAGWTAPSPPRCTTWRSTSTAS